MRKTLIILLVLIITSSCNEDKVNIIENNQTALYNDKTIDDEKSMAKSLPFIFQSNNNKLAGRILMAMNNEPKATIIFLHGNPGFEKNEDIGQALRRGGYNTVFFSYSGTWGNDGVFNYKNSINDVNSIIDYLISNSNRFKIDKEQVYLCGFSMGADIAILTAKTNEKIKGVISIDPWNGYFELSNKTEKDLCNYKKNVEQRPCIKIKSGNDFVSSIIENREMDLQASLCNFSKPITHIFSRENDKNAFYKNCNLTNQELQVVAASDHSFSDKRISLTNEIALWLNNQNKQRNE